MSDHGSVQYVSQYFHLLHVQGFHVFRVSWGRILVLDGTGHVFTAGLYLLRMCQLCILFSPFSREVWWKSVFVED